MYLKETCTNIKGVFDMHNRRDAAASAGISMGSALAMILSWSTHHSIFWAIVNGLFSWFYVIYWYIVHGS